MHYSDLVSRTRDLPEGRHVIYDLPEGQVELHNIGIRHALLSPRPEFQLVVRTDGRTLVPRHSDFLADFLLKIETRPELRLPLAEACEHVCNGHSPQDVMNSKRLPRQFAEAGEATFRYQTSMQQTGGMPTELFLCGLQGLIRSYELNGFLEGAPEAFRQAFLALEKGQPYVEVASRLAPQVRPGKRYFNQLYREG